MKAGDTFLYPLPQEHLWVAVTNPNADGEVLIVNITTVRNDIDRTVILRAKEHPFLTKPSYVYYREAMIKQVSELEGEEKALRLKKHADCAKELLGLICAGISASEHTRPAILKFYKACKDI